MDWSPWENGEDEDFEEFLHDPDSWKSFLDGRDAAVLSGGSPREILQRLVDGDPLGIRPLCSRVLAQHACFLDPQTVLDRTFARVAYDADLFDGSLTLKDFLVGRIRKSIQELLDEQLSEELGGVSPSRSSERDFYEDVARIVGVRLRRARSICCSLNALDLRTRSVFHRVLVEGQSLRKVSEELNRPIEVLQGEVRAGLLAISEGLTSREARALRRSLQNGASS